MRDISDIANNELCSVKDRLLRFIEYKKLNIRQFEEMAGLSSSYVSNMRKSIKPTTFDEKIAPIFPELNKLWLLHGEGEMIAGRIPEEDEKSDNVRLKKSIKNRPHDEQMEILYNEVVDVEKKIDLNTAALIARQDIQDRDVVILNKKIEEQNRTLIEIKDMLQMVLKNI